VSSTGVISPNLIRHGQELETGGSSDSVPTALGEHWPSQVIENRMTSFPGVAINSLDDTDTSGNGTDYDDGIPEESDDAASVTPVEPSEFL
jgi:hypothetical protein